MERTRAIQEIRARGLEVLAMITPQAKNRVNGKTSYICPIPGCGHGTNGDGLTENPQSKDGHGLKCFGCGFAGDIIDLIMQTDGKDFNAALDEAAGYLGISIDQPDHTFNFKIPTERPAQTKPQPQEQPSEQPPEDYTAFLLQAQKANTGAYLEGRGISKTTQELFGVGFVEKWKHPKRPQDNYYPVVIFPKGKYAYTARYIIDKEELQELVDSKKLPSKAPQVNSKAGKEKAPYFCEKLAFESSLPIFIVEGEADALSLWELGYTALPLGGVGNTGRFIELAEARKDKQYIIALDNDKAGAGGISRLSAALTEKGISYTIADINGHYKDPNERLQKDKNGLQKALKLATLQATDPDQYKAETLKANNVAAQLANFWEEIKFTKNFPPISTGFPLFDEALDGGLYPEQLVFLGAISSLGKTTFLLQVIDNIAAAGTPVLFFSLEMSRNEIISKSISRNTFEIAIKEDIKTNNAKSMRGISAYNRYSRYSNTEKELINKASKAYSEGAGKNLYIYEGNGETGIEEIQQTVREFIKLTGKRPLIFIDYLQILAPADARATDKQNTDYAVKVLKQLARDESIAVLAISSLNRANYHTPISMEAFKESGAIEYSSDILLGLQLQGMGTSDFNVNEAKRKNPREVELHFLKNRNGVMSKPILFNYYPTFNYYKEIDYVPDPPKEEKKSKGKSKSKTAVDPAEVTLTRIASAEDSEDFFSTRRI